MRFTLDAAVLLQALKRLNLRRNMESFVYLQAQDGKLRLMTRAFPDFGQMQATTFLTEALTIEVEGTYAVRYKELVGALKNFEGRVTLRREGSAVIVSCTGLGDFIHQTPIEGKAVEEQLMKQAQELEGTTYTKSEVTSEQCPSCSSLHRKTHVHTYQITRIVTQAARVAWTTLSPMLKQVMWAVAESDYRHLGRTGIAVALRDGVLSLRAADGYSAATARELLPSGGHWEYGILPPAKLFAHALQLFPKTSDLLIEGIVAQHQQIKSDDEDTATASPFFNGVVVRLSGENLYVSLSLLNESFPDFPSTFPDPQARIVCPTADLLKAVSAVGRTADDSSNEVWLNIGEARLGIEARHNRASLPALHEVPLVERSGETLKLPLRGFYLQEAVRSVSSSQVLIEISAPDKPVLIRPNNGPDTYLGMIMQMKVY